MALLVRKELQLGAIIPPLVPRQATELSEQEINLINYLDDCFLQT